MRYFLKVQNYNLSLGMDNYMSQPLNEIQVSGKKPYTVSIATSIFTRAHMYSAVILSPQNCMHLITTFILIHIFAALGFYPHITQKLGAVSLQL